MSKHTTTRYFLCANHISDMGNTSSPPPPRPLPAAAAAAPQAAAAFAAPPPPPPLEAQPPATLSPCADLRGVPGWLSPLLEPPQQPPTPPLAAMLQVGVDRAGLRCLLLRLDEPPGGRSKGSRRLTRTSTSVRLSPMSKSTPRGGLGGGEEAAAAPAETGADGLLRDRTARVRGGRESVSDSAATVSRLGYVFGADGLGERGLQGAVPRFLVSLEHGAYSTLNYRQHASLSNVSPTYQTHTRRAKCLPRQLSTILFKPEPIKSRVESARSRRGLPVPWSPANDIQ